MRWNPKHEKFSSIQKKILSIHRKRLKRMKNNMWPAACVMHATEILRFVLPFLWDLLSLLHSSVPWSSFCSCSNNRKERQNACTSWKPVKGSCPHRAEHNAFALFGVISLKSAMYFCKLKLIQAIYRVGWYCKLKLSSKALICTIFWFAIYSVSNTTNQLWNSPSDTSI